MRRNPPGIGSKLITLLLLAATVGGTSYYYINVENNAQAVQNGSAESMYFVDTIEDGTTTDSGSGTAAPVVSTSSKDMYTKLSKGETVNIAVVGDTFGKSTGATEGSEWSNVLADELTEKYGSEVNVVDYSVPQTSAYQGYCTAMEKNWSDIDLAILCYGATDQTDVEITSFQRNYEAAVRALMTKNPNMTVMPMISTYVSDSNFSGTIREVAEYYGLTCLNMNNAFVDSGYTEDELLSEGGIYPNDAGYKVYADYTAQQIDEIIQSNAAPQAANINNTSALYADVMKMDEYTFIDVSELTEDYDGNYSLTGRTGRIVGVAYTTPQTEGDTITVYIDGVERSTVDCSSSYDTSDTHYSTVAAEVSKTSTITISTNFYNGAELLGVIVSK